MKHLKLYESFFSDILKKYRDLESEIESMRKDEEERFKDALTPIIDNYECEYELTTRGLDGEYCASFHIGEDCSISDLCRDLEEFNLNIKHMNPFDGKYKFFFHIRSSTSQKSGISYERAIEYLKSKDKCPSYISLMVVDESAYY